MGGRAWSQEELIRLEGRTSGMEPGKMSDLRTGMLETNIKTGTPAEKNASSLHRVRTQNRK